MTTPDLAIQWLPGRYAICRLDGAAPIPDWAMGLGASAGLLSITRTPTELSIIIDEALVPAEIIAESGRAAFRIAGTLDFALTGILARIATLLADAEVSIFALSTYDTDVVLVQAADQIIAERAIEQNGIPILR